MHGRGQGSGSTRHVAHLWHTPGRTWPVSGQHELSQEAQDVSTRGLGEGSRGDDFYFRSFAQGWPAEGINK